MLRQPLWPALVLAAALLLAWSGETGAQDGELAVDVQSVDDAGYPTLRAVVSVARDGAALPGLDAGAFSASLNGSPLRVVAASEATKETSGADIALVVDVSGSMAGAPMEQARQAVREFIAALQPRDRVALIAFSDDVRVLLDYATDRAAALAATNGLEAQGDTALYQAVAEAARLAAQSTATRRAVILLSDGLDFGGRSLVTRDQSLIEAVNSRVPFYAVGLGNQIDRAYLEYLATATAGRFLEAPSPDDLAGLYRAIAVELQSQYVLELDATGVPLPRPSELTVTLTSGNQQASGTATFEPRVSPVNLTVTLEGVAHGQEVRAGDVLRIVATPEEAVLGVTVRIDGVIVGELRTPPFAFTVPTLAEGPHELTVEARAIDGTMANAKASIVTPPPAAGGGGGSPLPLIGVAVVALAAVGGVGYVALRRRARRPQPIEHRIKPWGDRVPSLEDWRAWEDDDAPVVSVAEPLGRLVALTGAQAGQAFEIGARPVSIGSSPRCAVRLDATPDMAPEEARVWVRNGRLVVHKVATLTAMALEGASGGWVILDHGDDIDLGGVRFRFELAEQTPEATSASPSPRPPAQDRETPPPTGGPLGGMRPAPAPPQAPVEALEPAASETSEPPASHDAPISIFREGSRFAQPASPEFAGPTEPDAEPGDPEEEDDFDL